VLRAAQILGLEQLLHRYPRQLSGGQRQRVAMGRAIVRNPQVFLFDEPLSNLDAKLRVQMRSEIKALHQRLKVTTVYVTHDQIEAMTMADKIVVMNSGVIEQAGPPLDLYDRPANIFVAGFIGSPAMNVLDGQIVDGHFQAKDGMQWALPERRSASVGAPILYGIRPEHLRLDQQGMPANVVLVEPTGSETQVQLRVGERPITAAFRERITARPGETLRVAPDPAHIHLFDQSTGLRL
jgi:multiple sugar transport system ATP-binding protein